MSKRAIKRLVAEFERPDSSVSTVCATDALGLGKNTPDTDVVVVQWKAPPDVVSLLQRFGRAAQGYGRRGEATWFYQKSLRGERCQGTAEKRRKQPGHSRLREVMNAERDELEPEKAMGLEEEKQT